MTKPRNGVIEIDLQRRLVFVGGRELHFTRTEFNLLLVLADQAPAIVSPQDLVWQAVGYWANLYEARELVKWHIHHMRRKMRDNARKPRYIVNVRDVGYRLAGAILIHR